MNNNQNKFFQGINMLTGLWTIVYQSFETQGMSETDAINHTKALMSIMVDSVLDIKNEEETNDPS